MSRPAFFQVLIKSQPFRVFQMMFGVLLMAVGPLLLAPTPGPFGTIVFAFGFALVLRNSFWVRRRYVRYSRSYPRVQKMINFGLRRKSKRKPTDDALETGVEKTGDAAGQTAVSAGS